MFDVKDYVNIIRVGGHVKVEETVGLKGGVENLRDL